MTKTKPKPKRTPEQRRAHVASIRDQLTAWYEQVPGETLAAYVARFDGYSDRNAHLIGMQRPGATDVRGFQEWRKHGRQVRKGEKGIAIFAPIPQRDSEDGELAGVRVVYVFDVEQTDPLGEAVVA